MNLLLNEVSTRSSTVEAQPLKSVADQLDDIIRTRAVRSLYQPIVELDSGATVAWEALARGPVGSGLEFPDRLFGAAARLGRKADLDHCCRAAAIEGAISAGLGTNQELFINLEPDIAGTAVPDFLARAEKAAESGLRLTVEITERALTTAPAELMALVDSYRRRGWGIAIDDVGQDPRSIALMPMLHPDVIKLDMAFVHERMTRERARVLHAVAAEAERTGALIVAEGIETEAQAEMAQNHGATLAQGWLFGRPGTLKPGPAAAPIRRTYSSANRGQDTPFEHVRERRTARIGTKAQLLQMSLALEDQALAQGESGVLMSTFQEARHFPAHTRVRYAQLAQRVAFVGALARDLYGEPAPGVRGSALDPRDDLCHEWDVVVLGPHFAGAFVARDLGDVGADSLRRFRYIVTYDRELVVAAATRLMRRIAPAHR